MNFNSPSFILFIVVVITINYFLSQRLRSSFLLLASLTFIAFFNIDSLIAVLFLSALNFNFGKRLVSNRTVYRAGIVINTFAIVLFNYLITSREGLSFYLSGINFEIESFIIAVGVSFYSLQNIAYLTEVYYGRSKAETSYPNYLLYTSFFPKIISGPVMLPKEFLPQINKNEITSESLTSGFNRFLLGLFKKMVVADRLAPMVQSVFDYNDTYHGFTSLIGVYAFTIQLYFDFSGYTDMALGIGKMLGFDLKENFNTPLRSKSISEFWRRWHISLISWFTNYIYYPLVYRLRAYKKRAALVGILTTFIISGVWHGIGLTFLAWAGCHAIYLCIELLTKRFRLNLSERFDGMFYKIFLVAIVFNAVCFSNIFFRAGSVEVAFQLIGNIFSNFMPTDWLVEFIAPLAIGGHQVEQFNLIVTFLLPLLVLLFERKINRLAIDKKYSILFVTVCVLLIMIFGIFNSGARFIYMQF